MAVEAPQPFPPMMGHLSPELSTLRRVICIRTLHDLFICEVPPGSNSSGRIDRYNARAGAPLGSYWCASEATAVYVDAGADVPPTARASCDVLVWWAMDAGLWKTKDGPRPPLPGDMVLYTNGELLPTRTKLPNGKLPHPGQLDAHHVGILVRTVPYLCSAEGNAAWSGFSRNGEAVLGKRVDVARVYGYIEPRPRAA